MAATPPRPDPRRIPDVSDRALAQRPETMDDLALRIEMAELRVVRRDLEFRLHVDSLRQRGKAVLVPSRWLLPALGTGASWLFWRVVRRRPKGRGREQAERHGADRHGHRAQRERHGGAGMHAHGGDAGSQRHDASAARGAGAGHLQLLTMLWGFLPLSLRGRVHPEIAQMLLGVIAGYMQGRKEQRAESHASAGAAPER